MMQETKIDVESHAVPFQNIAEVTDFLPYGDQIRVIFQFLVVTGSRIAEINKFVMSQLYRQEEGFILCWKLGKNQKTYRKEVIPERLVKELLYCREKNRCYQDMMFSISANSFRRYFNRDVRPHLSNAWQEKSLQLLEGHLKEQYRIQLKGLRKNFQTLMFAKELERWKDSGVALEMVSKRMRHSSARITAYHYICNFETLQIQKYIHCSPEDLLKESRQKRLYDFI